MKKINEIEVEECCDCDNELTSKELKVLAKILEEFEWREYCESGLKNISGGYVSADVFNYDDEYIDIQVESGEQDCGSGFSSCDTSTCKLPRKVLLKKMSLERKLKAIEFE